MRLICYPTSGEPPRIIAAPVERDWMDRTPNGFAYRCLPLNIANAHGWLILNTVQFVAEWSGDAGFEGVSISAMAEGALLASSHFGSGVLTFSVNGLFHTEPGYDLLATGPFNSPKDAIQPLTGIIETDWSPFTFTMNWTFTRKRSPIAFERDEPFCMVFPMPRGLVEAVKPEFRSMDEEPAVQDAYRTWSESRQEPSDMLRGRIVLLKFRHHAEVPERSTFDLRRPHSFAGWGVWWGCNPATHGGRPAGDRICGRQAVPPSARRKGPDHRLR